MRRRRWVAFVALGLVVVVLVAVPVIHGVHPDGALGLGDGIVGAGTFVLAVGTGVLALRTSAMADETCRLAEQAREGMAASAVQFRQERMPVVMPVAELVYEDMTMHVIGEERERPVRLPYAIRRKEAIDALVIVPIENVGAGPALDVAASLYFLDQTGARSVAGQPFETRAGVLPALGPGQMARLRCAFRDLATNPVLPFQLVVEYRDGAGGVYRVTSVYYPGTMSYGPVAFEPPAELRLPGTKPAPIPLPGRLPRTRARPTAAANVIPDEPQDSDPDDLLGSADAIYE